MQIGNVQIENNVQICIQLFCNFYKTLNEKKIYLSLFIDLFGRKFFNHDQFSINPTALIVFELFFWYNTWTQVLSVLHVRFSSVQADPPEPAPGSASHCWGTQSKWSSTLTGGLHGNTSLGPASLPRGDRLSTEVKEEERTIDSEGKSSFILRCTTEIQTLYCWKWFYKLEHKPSVNQQREVILSRETGPHRNCC